MKGFIEVTRNNALYLVSLNAIASVSESGNQTRIILLVTDKSGEPDKFFVSETYTEVVKLIENAVG